MDANGINKLQQFFLTSLVRDVRGGVNICFRKKGVKFEEKDAILTDMITYNGLSIGDSCLLAESPYFNSDNYELDDVKEYKKEVLMKSPRIVLAFFKLEAKMTQMKRIVRVKQIFCATGKVRVERTDWERKFLDWIRMSELTTTIVIGKIPIVIDVFGDDGKGYVTLFQANLLKKREEESIHKE
ncbi:hypothetical protein KJ866_02255 [Patescibacteria group bacterium]|nr:hypothetical protein [Patescibacteria group bacterium]MBU2219853.1 hypothetical protein [Patescibacteria group bacterium]